MSIKKKNKIEPIKILKKEELRNEFNEKRRRLNEIKKNKSGSVSHANFNSTQQEKFAKTFTGKNIENDAKHITNMINNFEKKVTTTNY